MANKVRRCWYNCIGLAFQYQILKKKEKRMDKNKCKLKILYNCIKANIPVPYGSIGCTYRQLKYSSPNRSKTKNKTRATQKSLPFGKKRNSKRSSRAHKCHLELNRTFALKALNASGTLISSFGNRTELNWRRAFKLWKRHYKKEYRHRRIMTTEEKDNS